MLLNNLNKFEGNAKYIIDAVHYSTQSCLKHRHGCVIVKGGKVISGNYNTHRSKWSGSNRCSTHAEMAALLSVRRRQWVLRGYKKRGDKG